MKQTTKRDTSKCHGVHYTPPELARFLAEAMASELPDFNREFTVLDPACGDGALLKAFCEALPKRLRSRCVLVGYETDAAAARRARQKLKWTGVADMIIDVRDFLASQAASIPGGCQTVQFDALIANPPYVRTQVLGSAKSQSLAREFGLTGRVDLYHAFIRAIANVLKPGGALGLLTSNRFLTIKSGEVTRSLLQQEFRLKSIYDLGDTRLFNAAVLPVIVVGQRSEKHPQKSDASVKCSFDRVYEYRSKADPGLTIPENPSILNSLRDRQTQGLVRTPKGLFQIERGELKASPNESIWSLSTGEYQQWLATVARRQVAAFEDVARVRVGIKTTADDVFLRHDWTSLAVDQQPESQLIRPLIRHFNAARWKSQSLNQAVLYPHEEIQGRRIAVDLDQFPRARHYLRQYYDRLNQRQYLIESGRKWYEIWVPHSPSDWAEPKIVCPDISEEPRFFLDRSGAVVNGDCYWITLRKGIVPEMLLLMLAVANSSLMTRYYDIVFHNKLYAGRRRYMTQYVKKFPLPDIESPAGRSIVSQAAALLKGDSVTAAQETQINRLVWQAFGFDDES